MKPPEAAGPICLIPFRGSGCRGGSEMPLDSVFGHHCIGRENGGGVGAEDTG